MMSASTRIHAAMGSALSAECADRPEFRCWICGSESARGMLREDWQGASFVGQNRARALDSDLVCESCVVVMAGRPPATLRMYSHLLDDRGWLKLNKGDKPRMREWLRGPKAGEWIAAIADSGQKHIVPWTPVNPALGRFGFGRVLFEERVVDLGDWSIVDAATALLTAGVTKEELGRGEYGPRAWSLAADELRAFERTFGRLRGGGWYDLAVWLAQRDEAATQARMEREKEEKRAQRERQGKTPKRDRGRAARGEDRVPENGDAQRAQTLGPHPEPPARREPNDEQCRGVGDGHEPGPAIGCAQLGLFDSGAGSRRRRA